MVGVLDGLVLRVLGVHWVRLLHQQCLPPAHGAAHAHAQPHNHGKLALYLKKQPLALPLGRSSESG